jgi:hypothetical protein
MTKWMIEIEGKSFHILPCTHLIASFVGFGSPNLSIALCASH